MVCGPRPHLVIFSNVKINLKNCKMDHRRFVFIDSGVREPVSVVIPNLKIGTGDISIEGGIIDAEKWEPI